MSKGTFCTDIHPAGNVFPRTLFTFHPEVVDVTAYDADGAVSHWPMTYDQARRFAVRFAAGIGSVSKN